MSKNISSLFSKVNKRTVLILQAGLNKLVYMKYGQRLRQARKECHLTQAQLAELSGVNQSLISQLENSQTATGSEYTNRLARAMNISADWLADEIGEMNPMIYSTADPKIIAAARVMEAMPEYGKDAAVKEIASTAQLIEAAQHQNNGTDG